MLVVPACADSPERPPRVMLIDFNMSHFSCDEDDQEDEMDVLRALFRCLGSWGCLVCRLLNRYLLPVLPRFDAPSAALPVPLCL